MYIFLWKVFLYHFTATNLQLDTCCYISMVTLAWTLAALWFGRDLCRGVVKILPVISYVEAPEDFNRKLVPCSRTKERKAWLALIIECCMRIIEYLKICLTIVRCIFREIIHNVDKKCFYLFNVLQERP